ncbi:hypothetical protein EIP91_001985 [Steccherinum ochraceum]|uniref:Uncharacterized protein n=1 Tax=Steccherinum ochraceum TaxID=92696 RepID=A0A4R0RJA1_9APHY|nr:hypothetical protein EIP91_001985 [Steccherinum ochraceum]
MSSNRAPFGTAEYVDGWSSAPFWYKSEHAAPMFSPISTSNTFDSGHPLCSDRRTVDTQMFEVHQSQRFPTASHLGHPDNDTTYCYSTYDANIMHQQTTSSYGHISTYSQYQERGYSLFNGLNITPSYPYVPGQMQESTFAAPSSEGPVDTTSSSFATSAHLANFAQASSTLSQYVCANQGKSRHDPGGGLAGSYDDTETLQQVAAYHHDRQPEYPNIMDEPLPIASPHSSALYNAIIEVPALAPRRQPTRLDAIQIEDAGYATDRNESFKEQLQYPDESSQSEGSSSASTTPISQLPTPFTLTPLDKARKYPVRMEVPPPERVKYKRGTPTRVACYFCRKRKIACGGPPEGTKDGACGP